MQPNDDLAACGPGPLDCNFSLVKDTHLKWLEQAGNFQFRAEFFNILNHTNFAIPYTNDFNANYQAIVSAGTAANGTDVAQPRDKSRTLLLTPGRSNLQESSNFERRSHMPTDTANRSTSIVANERFPSNCAQI